MALLKQTKTGAKSLDTKEFELPDTTFVSTIDNSVLKGIVMQCLSQIEGISLVESNFIGHLFGHKGSETMSGIFAEQDQAKHSVIIKIEINVCYGISIPAKAEEIQTKIAEEVTKLTGLQVGAVHVTFKGLMPMDPTKKMIASLETLLNTDAPSPEMKETDYSEEF